MKHIRNFAIIAHVDHGKSTLADRLLEITSVVQQGKHEEQLLDRNPISRERGITIKLAPVQMQYDDLTLNLIDTPGHVDFSYEVDRTLACVEGVILLIDATQGIQAQTIANAYKALEKDLVIIPALNKIDMPNAEIDRISQQLEDFLGVKKDEIFHISAKTGQGVQELLDAVVRIIPQPTTDEFQTQQALIFDSYYDQHKGVIAFVRVYAGSFSAKTAYRLGVSRTKFESTEVGLFQPELVASSSLDAGSIGYIVTNMKDIHNVRVGDTIVDEKGQSSPISGYKKVNPMVFASVFPTDPAEYLNLKKALEKLYLNDSSLEFTAIYSQALGAGFRVGFLGLLHADVIVERLEREFDLALVITPPHVKYKWENNQYWEPYVKLMIITPNHIMGQVLPLCESYRATFVTMTNTSDQVTITYEIPMSELISDFFDTLKSVTSGYASLDWEFLEYRAVNADKLELLINGDPIDEFSEIVVQNRAFEKAQKLTKTMKEVIPRQQFEVRIQAKFKGKIIASERHAPFRKDVTAKLYGGDRTRKDKLLKKQKEGKKQMKMIGKVEVPKEAFMKVFKSS